MDTSHPFAHDDLCMANPLELLLNAKKVGYVFGGGSARCAFQIGVMEQLALAGVKPALSIGVSAGAWNAALVAAGLQSRARYYWKSFVRMPHVDLRGLYRNQSPYRFTEMHRRTFRRFVGTGLHAAGALPLWISVTRLRDRENVMLLASALDDPLDALLATNFLPPFFTHAPKIDGETYGDGGVTNNAPYEKAFEEGCDAVVLIVVKGESEGGIYHGVGDVDHVIPAEYLDRIVVIRPRHRLPFRFTERRWAVLEGLITLGALRAREVLYGERHPATDVRAAGESPSVRFARVARKLGWKL